MNMRILSILIIIAIQTFLTGCAAPAGQTQPTQASPTRTPVVQEASQQDSNSEIVLNMVERLNAGDVEGSLAYFAEDGAAYLMGLPPTGIEIYRGKEQIRRLWEDSVSNHFQWEVSIISAVGDLVNIKAKTWHDFTRQIEVAPLEYMDVYEVVNGKIITYGSWLTEDSLSRFRPAFSEAVPAEPTSTPFTDPPVSEMTVTLAEGSCTTDYPIALQVGEVKVIFNVEDQDNTKYAVSLFNLDEGKDILDLMVSTIGIPPSWGDILLLEELGPGKSGTYIMQVEKGPIYLICWSSPPDMPIGNAGPIEVMP